MTTKSRPSVSHYNGPLDRQKMPKKVLRAYEIFNSQKARSKKLGFDKPQYEAREFIDWWIENTAGWVDGIPSCGRIDHKKGYSFKNIRVESESENSREAILRNFGPQREKFLRGKKVNVFSHSNVHIATIPSIREAAELFGISQRLMQFLLRGKYKKSRKINFLMRASQ